MHSPTQWHYNCDSSWAWSPRTVTITMSLIGLIEVDLLSVKHIMRFTEWGERGHAWDCLSWQLLYWISGVVQRQQHNYINYTLIKTYVDMVSISFVNYKVLENGSRPFMDQGSFGSRLPRWNYTESNYAGMAMNGTATIDSPVFVNSYSSNLCNSSPNTETSSLSNI